MRPPVVRLLYSQRLAPYLFILPFLVTLAVFWFIPPVARSFVMSTQEVLYGQTTSVGMDNYARLWNDSVFWTAMRNSARYMVLTLLLLIPIPMMLAAVVSSRIGSRRVKAFFKASMFVPALTSVVVSGLVFRLMFSESDSALMNQVVQFFGFGPVRWLREDLTGLAALLALAVWRWTGVNTMYFIAGMQSIPAEYYEAAAIDGANKRQQFLRITVPQPQADDRVRHDDQRLRRPGHVPGELHALRRERLPEQPGADGRRLPVPQGHRAERPRLRVRGGGSCCWWSS